MLIHCNGGGGVGIQKGLKYNYVINEHPLMNWQREHNHRNTEMIKQRADRSLKSLWQGSASLTFLHGGGLLVPFHRM